VPIDTSAQGIHQIMWIKPQISLRFSAFVLRKNHCVIADLVGERKHIRIVPVPLWANRAVDEWTGAAAITCGAIFRRVSQLDKIWGDGITPKAIWHVVKAAAKRADIKNLAPHDLRRTCARLCHLAGGELEQIQFLLGPCRFRPPECYIGCQQKLRQAVNNKPGLEDTEWGGDAPQADSPLPFSREPDQTTSRYRFNHARSRR
jgi:site-specific recombinase XerD